MSDADRLPAESLSPLAARVDEALALYGYEMRPTIDAIDDAVPGIGGLFDPQTDDGELRQALDTVLAGESPSLSSASGSDPSPVVLYVDGSSRGNPGPAGAGAVIQTPEDTTRLGRPVGSHADNNTAEYAALHLGLDAVATRYDPAEIEVRIDSMTVIESVWGDRDGGDSVAKYTGPIADLRSVLPAQKWTHLADSDPNPADARATVGADIAELGPG